MPDLTLGTDDIGVYEIPITGGSTQVVQVAPGNRTNRVPALMAHQGSSPVYVRAGSTVTAKDPKATMIPPSTWSNVETDGSGRIAITSAADAVVSVYRS